MQSHSLLCIKKPLEWKNERETMNTKKFKLYIFKKFEALNHLCLWIGLIAHTIPPSMIFICENNFPKEQS
jgi:hypothetical protein